MKTILYIHGLASTRNSRSVANLRKYLPQYNVEAFDVPFNPEEAAEYVCEASRRCDLMVGSSLGGFYAQFGVSEVPRILINPALHAADNIFDISGYGTYEYFGPRTDGIQTFETTLGYYEKLRGCERRISLSMTEEQSAKTRVILGTADEVLGDTNHALCIERYGNDNIIRMEMMHQMSEECVRDIVVPLVIGILSSDDNKAI